MELSKFAEFQRNPIVKVGDYTYINPRYCETEEDKFAVYKVYELYEDGTAMIVPIKNDPNTIIKQQTFIHTDKLQVIYEP